MNVYNFKATINSGEEAIELYRLLYKALGKEE